MPAITFFLQELSLTYPVLRSWAGSEPAALEQPIGPAQVEQRNRYTAKYWRRRAEETRAVALQLRRPDRRRIMLDISAGYERMASMVDRLATRDVESKYRYSDRPR